MSESNEASRLNTFIPVCWKDYGSSQFTREEFTVTYHFMTTYFHKKNPLIFSMFDLLFRYFDKVVFYFNLFKVYEIVMVRIMIR